MMKGDPCSLQRLLDVNSLLGAFVRFLTLPNYLSVTSWNCITTRSSFPNLFTHQKEELQSARIDRTGSVLYTAVLYTAVLKHYTRL